MQIQDIIKAVQSKQAGGFITLKSERELATKKGSPRFFKKSKMQLRVKHSYYNQKKVKEAHASGKMSKAEPSDLWHEACKLGKGFRQHKKTKAVYIAGQPSGNKPTSEFFTENGKKINKSDIEGFLLAKEKRKSASEFIAVTLESVTYAK